ncbi:unnamed protein product [Adineta steineri]|uniref:BTB domain-containing protein n=1 Tax=Adineta steineri TaxID=433720 RepID=A0A814M822_9BILA|nr:unnamed protein product [Adineta steineri]
MSDSTLSSLPSTSTSVLQKESISGTHHSFGKYVKLNVGNHLFLTSYDTLTKEDTMFKAMFSGRMEVIQDSEGWVLIDRDGEHFNIILNYLRDGTLNLTDCIQTLNELLHEAKFYCIQTLIELIEQHLRARSRKTTGDTDACCKVIMLTSAKELPNIVATVRKPIVKLAINRHNNKYSYTASSDEMLMKNIELFDKLSIRLNNRILFIKDVTGSEEICCWSFYGNGQKMAEVCCTSIVYATERKQNKVEFFEARIYEETLNILLYENRNTSVDEIIRATTPRLASAALTDDDYDEERFSTTNSASGVPSEPFIPIFGQLFDIIRATKQNIGVEYFNELAKKHVECELLPDILSRSKAEYYEKTSFVINILKPLIGVHNLIVNKHAEHERARRMLNPAFNSINLQSTDSIRPDIQSNTLTFSIIALSAFGQSFETIVNARILNNSYD